jgi:LacI family transcriptional regulator
MPYKRGRKTTITDIANRCAVSTQTVSRVINNKPDVSDETRAKVQSAIKEMNYYPSAVARSLVKQHSLTIGVVIGGLRYSGVANTLDGITKACEETGYSLIIIQEFQIDSPNIVQSIETLLERQVEGIIYAVPDVKGSIRQTQERLPSYCPPIVFLKCEPDQNFTTLSLNNYGGARKAVEYLFTIGRKNIGLIAGPLDWLESRQRKQGWEDVLRERGIEPSPNKWVEGDWLAESGESGFHKLCQSYPEMDAVFVSNDTMALGAMHYASTHGLRIPQDFAVIGFDDLPEAAFFIPSLSSVTHPLRELGRKSVRILVEQIQNKSQTYANQTIVLDTGLVIREST